MANALFYYRTLTTRAVDGGFSDPDDLPPAQKLLFTPPSDILSGIDETWTNNIVKIIPPASRGKKRVQKDEGKAPWILTLSGNYTVSANEAADKLHAFRNLSQEDSYHIYGNFGIKYPNGPSYLTQDCTNTKGFMIEQVIGKHIGVNKEIFDFGVTISFGGTV